MSLASHVPAEVCHVLLEDRELGEAVPERWRARAIQECVARTLRLYPGAWSGASISLGADGLGLLVLEGLLIRRVGVDGRFGAELLGEGDLLRPWEEEQTLPALAVTTGWQVLEASRIAVLDEQFAHRLAPYPPLAARLVSRAMQRARNLAVNMAIVHHPRADVRVQMLLWHLAARWGRVGPEGVVVPLRLTHSMISDLVAARRPTVSSAISELTRRGVLKSGGDRWLLAGEPPGELELGPLPLASADPSS
jgi:hypothetical protein